MTCCGYGAGTIPDVNVEEAQAQFKQQYGFELWWVGGGYWSSLWRDLFDHYEAKNAQMPQLLKAVDYSIEGIGASNTGLEKIALEGFVTPAGNEAVVAISASFLDYVNGWGVTIKEKLSGYLATANAAKDEVLKAHIEALYNEAVKSYNEVITQIDASTKIALMGGVPQVKQVYADKRYKGLDSFPLVTPMRGQLLSDYASLYRNVWQGEKDIQQSVLAGKPVGLVAEVGAGISPEVEGGGGGGGAWKWLVGLGLVAAAVGTVGITVSARRRPAPVRIRRTTILTGTERPSPATAGRA